MLDPIEFSTRIFGSVGHVAFILALIVLCLLWFVGWKTYYERNPLEATVTLAWKPVPNADNHNGLDLLVTNDGMDATFVAQCEILETRNGSYEPRNDLFTMKWSVSTILDESVQIQNGITKRIHFAEIRNIDGNNGIVWIIQHPMGDSFVADAWTKGFDGVKPEWDIEVRISQKGARAPLVKRYRITIPAGSYVFDVKELPLT